MIHQSAVKSNKITSITKEYVNWIKEFISDFSNDDKYFVSSLTRKNFTLSQNQILDSLKYWQVNGISLMNEKYLCFVGTYSKSFNFDIVLKIAIKLEQKFPNIKNKNAGIQFNDVSFQYKTAKDSAIKNINLNIEGGKITALVGHSGAGKSTILNLIPRFYDPQSGDIKIDDQSIYKKKLSSIRNNISLVSQETTLFDDTVLNNIKYANLDASKEQIYEAAKLSYSSEFIDKLPKKYETIIGENGIRLSGGEKQRLSIARAILKKSKIILLDEATSSLDADTEKKIQDAINYLTKGRTTLVIAHRLSTILNSDKIFVISSGKVIGEGKHDELIKSSEVYKNFYEKQIQKG